MTTLELTGPELSVWLAEHVMGWERATPSKDDAPVAWIIDKPDKSDYEIRCPFTPHSDRNDLAEVLAKVPEKKQVHVAQILVDNHLDDLPRFYWFLLTTDPLIICKVIYEVMNNGH